MTQVTAQGGPGNLRTYVDDWRIVTEPPRQEAAFLMINTVAIAWDALGARGMKVSAEKNCERLKQRQREREIKKLGGTGK